MLRLFLISSFSLFCLIGYTQEYLGLPQQNFAGSPSMKLQPASIADSRYKFDMTLASGSIGMFNNYVGIKARDWRKDEVSIDEERFFDDYVVERKGDHKRSLYLGNDITLSSFQVNLNDQSALGVNWRIRTLFNVDGLEHELSKLILEELEYPQLWKQSFTNKSFSVQTMTWAEYGATYGRVLMDRDEHFVKAGGRVKLLQGLQAAYLYVDDLKYKFINDDTLSVFQSDVAYGHSDNFEFDRDNISYRFTSNPGLGFDLGGVYEWRPEHEKYKYDMNGRDNIWRKDKDKYKLKVGLSILDIGRIKFQKGKYSNNFHADTRNWDISNLDFKSVRDFDDTIRSRFEKNEDNREFKMNLPTSISLQIDYHIWKDFYVNFTPFWAFKFQRDVDKVHYFNNYSITPRWDWKWAGVSVPISYSNYTKARVGLMLRAGPLFVGTSDFRPIIKTGELYGGDLYAGVKIPIPFGHPKDDDNDQVSNERDECPETKGVWEFHGCPDTDNDHIKDSEDDCPAEAGLLEYNGCPDTDEDGIIDKKDDCPTKAGIEQFNGCPDTDRDSVPDSEDECPRVKGLKKFGGCPDSDGDGLTDNEDNCPDEVGPKDNFGCPDRTRLHLVDEYGDIVATATRNESGVFVFKKVDADKPHRFLLDTDDPNLEDEEIKVVLQSKEGPREFFARMSKAGFYRYIPGDKKELDLKEEVDESKVQLTKKQKDVVDKAFDDLRFDFGKAIIQKESYSSLNRLVDLLKKHEDWRIKLEGHTDSIGSKTRNLNLSRRRAQRVKRFLMQRGISDKRILVRYYGEARPIADNGTEKGREKNRRVEMTIVE